MAFIKYSAGKVQSQIEVKADKNGKKVISNKIVKKEDK